MTSSLTAEFVVLAYVPDPTREEMVPIAVAAREVGTVDNARLVLYVIPTLAKLVSKRHLDYLNELLQSWRQVSGDEVATLFCQLQELSRGPLSVQRSGSCAIGDLPQLATRVLGPNEALDALPARESS